MHLSFKAKFDGRAIVPEEAIELPQDQTLDVSVEVGETGLPDPSRLSMEEKERIYKAMIAHFEANPPKGPPIDMEQLRRENMYDDDGR